MIKYSTSFARRKPPIFDNFSARDFLEPGAWDFWDLRPENLPRPRMFFFGESLSPAKKWKKLGQLGHYAKPCAFNQLAVPRLSQTVPGWDKLGQKIGKSDAFGVIDSGPWVPGTALHFVRFVLFLRLQAIRT